MSAQIKFNPGWTQAFITRPTGLVTYLFVQCSDKGDSTIAWHIELCCQPDNTVSLEAGEPKRINISSAQGAVVTVRNTGFNDITVWTDY